MPRRRSWSDEDLAVAVSLSENLKQVCDLLGVAAGSRTYEQLRRHIKRIGLDASHLPPMEGAQRRSWSDDDLREVVATSPSLTQVLLRLGYQPSGGMHRFVRQKIANLGLETSHFVGQAWAKGLRHTVDRRMPLAKVLVENSTYTSNGRLRIRLIDAGLKPPRCEWCGLDTWRARRCRCSSITSTGTTPTTDLRTSVSCAQTATP